MKKIICLIALAVFYTQAINSIAVGKDLYPSPDIVVWGEVLEIGKAEQSVYPFRLIKYKVRKVWQWRIWRK